MDITMLWIGIVPIIVFVILDSFSSKRVAIGAAIAFACLEMVFTLVKFGTIDELTIFSVVLVAVFGWLSIKKNNDLFFKLQAAVLNFFFALALFFFYYVLDKPMFTFMLQKYFSSQMVLFQQKGIPEEYVFRLMDALSRDLGFWLLFHSFITAYAALRMSKWWWFFFRVPFFYIMLFLAMLIESRMVFGRG